MRFLQKRAKLVFALLADQGVFLMTKLYTNRKLNGCEMKTFGIRKGYTLLEIMISVTLMLMLMYGVAAIFSRVGGIMNETQSTMEMSNALRNTRLRLETDLKSVSVPLVPPRNSNSNEGYFCYIEGLGLPYTQQNGAAQLYNGVVSNKNDNPNYSRFAPIYKGIQTVNDKTYVNPVLPWDNDIGQADSSISDGDDILMFTAKAPLNQMFRGRFGNEMIEAEYAEIIWYLRGTTLYRRVLLIVPDAILQDKMQEMVTAFGKNSSTGHPLNIKSGYGFFRFYDVSVHLNANGLVVANTLGDLSNRANRYGYWRSMMNVTLSSDYKTKGQDKTASPYGGSIYNNIIANGWYYLRLPTLQESATFDQSNNNYSFRAGVPFGKNHLNNINDPNEWFGTFQSLTYSGYPKIDFWNDPNCWAEVNNASGDLKPSLRADGLFTQDVILTNVIAFDVKAWDKVLNKFVDLGAYPYGVIRNDDGVALVTNAYTPNGTELVSGSKSPTCLATFGNYNIISTERPFMPAVYDTWTEQYELDYLKTLIKYVSTSVVNKKKFAADVNKIPINGSLDSVMLQNYPPPYGGTPLTSLQVNIRVFDPRSRNIRNMSLQVNFNTNEKK